MGANLVHYPRQSSVNRLIVNVLKPDQRDHLPVHFPVSLAFSAEFDLMNIFLRLILT